MLKIGGGGLVAEYSLFHLFQNRTFFEHFSAKNKAKLRFWSILGSKTIEIKRF